MSSQQPTPTTHLQEQLAQRMRGLGSRTVLYQQNVAAALKVYNSDFLSVDILRERGPITAGELSKLTGLSTGSVTALIDRLEKNGFVRRQNDPNDRRKVIIVPIYEEKEDVSHIYMPLNDAMMELASTYSDEELTLITQFLDKASNVIEEQMTALSSIARSKSTS